MMFTHSPRRSAFVDWLEHRRLLAAGALDTTFSGDGIALANPAGATFISEDVVLQSDGKSVVVGNAGGIPRVARYNVDGSLDTGFGFSGFAQLPSLSVARAVAMQGSSIIVAGDANGTHFGTARLHPTGELDATFGIAGYRIVDVPGIGSHAYDVAVQKDSKIVVAGTSVISESPFNLGDDDFITLRLDVNGSVDTPFGGGDGINETNFTGGYDVAYGIAFDYTVPTSDPKYGSIFLVGSSFHDIRNAIAVAKLTPAGVLDNSFDGNGQLTFDIGPGFESVGRAAVVQPGSRLVVTGYERERPGPDIGDFFTIRFLANGAVDPSFGTQGTGYAWHHLGGNDAATDIAINYDGGLIVSGASDGHIAMVAYTADGVLDAHFDNNGSHVFLQTTLGATNQDPDPGTSAKIAVTGSTINPIRRLVVTGGSSGQTIRVVDVAPFVTIAAVDAEASETNSNTASFRILLDRPRSQPLRVHLSVGGTAIAPDDDRFTNDEDFNVAGITFGSLFTNASLTVPAGASSVLFTLIAVNDTLVEGDESVTFSIAASAAYDVGLAASTSMIIRDNEPPAVPFTVSKAFLFETLPLQATFTFSQNVGASLSIADFVFSAGLPTPAFSYNATLNTATLSWPAPLPDGTHNVRVKASGVTNSAGTHLNADSVNTFSVLAGDINRDGTVGFDDLLILAQNYGQSGRTFSQGNIDYSAGGSVNFDDLLVLAQRYGTSLAFSGATASTIKRQQRSLLSNLQ